MGPDPSMSENISNYCKKITQLIDMKLDNE